MVGLTPFEILKLNRSLNTHPLCFYFKLANFIPNLFYFLILGFIINYFFEIKLIFKTKNRNETNKEKEKEKNLIKEKIIKKEPPEEKYKSIFDFDVN
jgi:large-conductance mechanosensitive channel